MLEREEQVTNTVLSLARIWGFWPISSLSSCLCVHGFLSEFQKSEILKNGKNNDNSNNNNNNANNNNYYSNDKNNYSNNCHDENYYFNNCNNIIIRIIIITIIKLII